MSLHRILIVPGVALLYFVGAMLGHLLAIPPNFAAPVWPAAGFALAAIMLIPGILPVIGIFLGAVAANSINLAYEAFPSFDALAPGLFISLGSTVQAVIQGMVYRRFIGEDSRWGAPGVLVRFTLMIAIACSTVAATVGVITLYSAGVVTDTYVAFTWVTWLIGDAVGVLLVAPVANVVFSNPDFKRRQKIRSLIPFAAILAMVYLLFLKSLGDAEEKRYQTLQAEADHLANTIQTRLEISENKLSAYAALFVASDYVSREEFNHFSDLIMKEDSVFHGIGWTEAVDHAGRLKWEEYFRTHGFPDYVFTEFAEDGSLQPAAERDLYYPVLYIYPFELNKRAFGLNLAANEARRTALVNAAKLGKPVATAPIVLAQETQQQKAIIVYKPVFNPVDKSLVGYASGVMRLEGILGDSFERARQANLSFNLTDITDGGKRLYEAESRNQNHLVDFVYYRDFGTRNYEIEIFPSADYTYEADDWSSYVILTGGFIIAALFLAFTMTTAGTIESISLKVREKTSELEIAAQQANAASLAKSSFLANISHELRTPMNAIIGFLHLVLRTPLTPEQKRYLKNAQLASDTLLALINQTLDYAKIEAGKMELEVSVVDIRLIAEKMQALFGQVAQDKRLDFSIDIQESVPEQLEGDYLRTEQIVLNLLSNAFRFTSVGSVSLSFAYMAATHTLQIRVRDTGIGIPKEKLDHIFTAFGQVDVTTSREYGGTGLGLSICKRIASLMDGDILVRSTEGMGSEFCANLSLKEISQPLPVRRPIESIGLEEEDLPLTGCRILVVEDVAMNQIITRELLAGFGAASDIAENGVEALHQLRDGMEYDAVLMDIQMPVMDGYQATRRIRDDISASLPVIGMTANAMDSDIEQCLAAGMNAHVAKPVDPQRLLEVLISVCRVRQ